MATARYGLNPNTWNKHLRRWLKRRFWRRVRAAGKHLARTSERN